MKNLKFYIINAIFLLSSAALFYSCERDLSAEADFATYPTTAEIFTDGFVGMGEDFYFPFVQDGAKPDVFSVDNEEGYESNVSIRIDVPSADDPSGNFAGAFFLAKDLPRNLTGYDALTFWAKASAGAPMVVGFGEDQYQVTTDISLGSSWRKYIIPIPDPSKLFQEEGMMFFSAGTQHNGGLAYSIWFDEIQFENLGNIGQVRPEIMSGQDISQSTFIGVTNTVSGLTSTYNLGSGEDITVNVAPSYFQFSSSSPNVASVNQYGDALVHTAGSTTISAILDGVAAQGSLTLNSIGNFDSAPVPTRPASNVISIFSDAYNSVAVDYYNGFFAPFQTTQGGAIDVGGDSIISYTDLNFVAIGTFLNVPAVDASNMTHLHVDLNVQEAVEAGDYIRLELNNSIGNNETAGNYTINGADLLSNQWASFDIPLSAFSGPADKSQLGLYFFVSDATISNLFVDNYYFYTE